MTTDDLRHYIDDVFKRMLEQAVTRLGNHRIVENPFDAGKFVIGLDFISAQKSRALVALEALATFALEGPEHLQPLPLSYADREARKGLFDAHHLVALFARSWANTGYDARHPKFSDYASGILALPDVGERFLKEHPELASDYPPKLLFGLDETTQVTIVLLLHNRRKKA
jgi:hypothetical protein